MALVDRWKDDYFDCVDTLTEKDKAELKGKLAAIDEFFGIPVVIKDYMTMEEQKQKYVEANKF